MGKETMRNLINTKEKIKKQVIDEKQMLEETSRKDAHHSAAYYHAVFGLFDRFLEKLDSSILFKELEADWHYAVLYNYDGMSLLLIHDLYCGKGEDGYDIYMPDQEYTLFTLFSKYLTVDEYARISGVGVGTVRQWIRRGKIRTAKKYGNEWRISELSDPPQRGYTDVVYGWEEPLTSVPEEFRYLEGHSSVFIHQEEDKKVFQAVLFNEDSPLPGNILHLSTPERERLEVYLIGNPEVHLMQDFQESLAINLIQKSRK